MNPADFFLDALSGKVEGQPGSVATQDIPIRWRDAHTNNDQRALGDHSQGFLASTWAAFTFKFFGDRRRTYPSFFKLLALGAQRSALQCLRNMPAVFTDVIVHALVGLLLGLAFVARSLFIPPIPAEYSDLGLCPEAVNEAYCKFPIREDIGTSAESFIYCTLLTWY